MAVGDFLSGSGRHRFCAVMVRLGVYVLLLGGSALFAWPFLWMASTSMKLDREMFGEHVRFWPQRPVPQSRTPYLDREIFRQDGGPRMAAMVAVLEQHLSTLPVWPDDGDRTALIHEVARGVFHRMRQTLPEEMWDLPEADFQKEILRRTDPSLVREILPLVRRSIGLGALRARSYDRQEDELVAPDQVASAWDTGGSARLVEVTDGRQDFAELVGDFSGGDPMVLSGTFVTRFPVGRLHRLQLSLRPDDSWAAVTAEVEMNGRRLRAERPVFLADTHWMILTWQGEGPDDQTHKARTWVTLRDVGTGSVTDPHTIRVTLRIQKNTPWGAWWAKATRNYQLTFDHIPFWRYAGTSVFLVILNLVGTLFSCSLVAYSFARLQWPGRNLCFVLMLATMMVPAQVTMIPTFLIMRWLGWYNTLYPLWIGSFFAGAFNVFLLCQFLRGVPRDLEDAAKIDGCGFWRVYWHVMLPLVKPTLAAIGIFSFLGVWNEFMAPLIYLTDQNLYPLSLGLYALNVQSGGSMGMMMAGSLLMTLPVIVIFFFAQKYFVQGIALTGTKG